MSVVCDAIAKGGDDRKAVIDAFFATKGRESPLGTYDIDADGDTTLTDYGGYTAEGGKLVFNKVIKAQAPIVTGVARGGGASAAPPPRVHPPTPWNPHPYPLAHAPAPQRRSSASSSRSSA